MSIVVVAIVVVRAIISSTVVVVVVSIAWVVRGSHHRSRVKVAVIVRRMVERGWLVVVVRRGTVRGRVAIVRRVAASVRRRVRRVVLWVRMVSGVVERGGHACVSLAWGRHTARNTHWGSHRIEAGGGVGCGHHVH